MNTASIGLTRYPDLILGKNNGNLEGVTTVWLLSTLGNLNPKRTDLISNKNNVSNDMESKNNNINRNIKKKDIVNVSIPKTCKVIEDNAFELPLRYVSNLLFGIAICYNKKTEYVLNDLTTLIVQLQKKLYSANSIKRMNNKKANAKDTTIYNDKLDDKKRFISSFLSDDPMYDINSINKFASILGIDGDSTRNGNKSSNSNSILIIKRNDLLNELSNFNANENNNLLMTDSLNYNKHSEPDDIHLDIDFDLNIDDLEAYSQHGTSVGKSGSTESNSVSGSHHNNNLDINFQSQEFNLNFDENANEVLPELSKNDISNIDLEVSQESETDESLPDESFINENELGPSVKRLKLNSENKFMPLYSSLQIDQKISNSTEQLKTDFDKYNELMQRKSNRKKKGNELKTIDKLVNSRKFTTTQENIRLFLQDSLTNNYLSDNWNAVLMIKNEVVEEQLKRGEARNVFHFIERGRKRMYSMTPTSRSSSTTVPSQEIGRRMDINNPFDRDSDLIHNDFYDDFTVENRTENNNNNNNNLLLNLEQIDEDLEEGRSFINMNLDLPPSSFGRSMNRNSGTVGSVESDVINILQTKMLSVSKRSNNNSLSNKKGSDLESIASNETYSAISSTNLMDHQTKRFYDYIKERTSYVGKHSNSFPPFKMKVLFEDLVPSSISGNNSSFNGEKSTCLNKKIAASAFLSLLTLASKDIVGIGKYSSNNNQANAKQDPSQQFKVLRADEIIVYN